MVAQISEMILLAPENKILEETLRDRFTSEKEEKLLITVCDFDGVSYRLSTPNSKTVLLLSMRMLCFDQLNCSSLLQREYGQLLKPTPEPGYDVSLEIDLKQQNNINTEELVRKISLLKRNAMAAPFEVAFSTQAEGGNTNWMIINYREQEAIYIQAAPDRVTVIFSTVFKDEQDKVIGKVFLQEFVDARRLPQIQNAPQVLYSAHEPPLELRGLGLRDNDDLAYVTFVLFPRHFSTPERKDETIHQIMLFRDYLHYHIKCSKSYLHARMRARVAGFLKVLNRAKPDTEKEKKTASGKTFKR